MVTSTVSRAQVEDFLFQEADLIDEWKLWEWLDLFEADGKFNIPSTDRPEGDHSTTLYLIADDMPRLRSRVTQLLSGTTWAENPQSRTRHLVSNVQVKDAGEGIIHVTANFVIYRMRFQNIDPYIGKYVYKLVQRDGQLKILERTAILDLEALRPHGKVSFIV